MTRTGSSFRHFVEDPAEAADVGAMRGPNTEVELVRRLVGRLRERRADGVCGVLSELIAERDQAITDGLSRKAAAALTKYDQLMMTVLTMRYDAIDRAVRETGFGVAEIDGEGLISYANDAMARMVPDPVGREFATLFGPRAHHITQALSDGRRETLRLDLYHDEGPSTQLRGEISPLSDEHERGGAYALLLGLDGEEARLDASPDAILRVDADGKVMFANVRAEQLLGASRADLSGRLAVSLFAAETSGAASPIGDCLRSADCEPQDAQLLPVDGRGAFPVRVTIVPFFDTAVTWVGATLTFVPTARERARHALQQLLYMSDCEPECLVRGVMAAIRGVIPFDLATFGIFTDDMNYHRTLVVYSHPEPPDWEWTTAWFPLEPAVRDFLLSQQTWGPDLQKAVETLTPDQARDDVVVKLAQREKIKSFATLPISGGYRNFRAALTLYSRGDSLNDGEVVRQMRDLDVEQLLLVAEANLLRRRRERVRALEKKLAEASDYRGLAGALASGIADCFGWDYVAVFGVDRRQEKFRLIEQTPKTETVEATLEQPLGEGLLGAALQNNARRSEPDIGPASRFGFKATVHARRSATVVPIRVAKQVGAPGSDHIEWMLRIESKLRNAFQGPDMEALETVVALCESILEQRWQRAVQACLLSAAEQAVIVVDQAGKIRLTNLRADQLLCRPNGSQLGCSLAELGAEEADCRLLGSSDPVSQRRVTLRGGEGMRMTVLASQQPVDDDYGHRLWLLTDLREVNWQSDSSYLERTVSEVAHSARLPLMLAGSLLRGVSRQLTQEPAHGMLDRAVRQLNKADITYERLASTLTVYLDPEIPPQLVDAVRLLQRCIRDLPQEDVAQCDLSELNAADAPNAFLVRGWPNQLGFVFRSVLGHLLIQRAPSAKVTISLRGSSKARLRITLSLTDGTSLDWLASTPSDPIAAAEFKARETATLAPDAIERAIARHGGRFATGAHNATAVFTIELPEPPSEVAGEDN